MARTIRVFISSTFRDMHAERAAITRLVFPELRSRCRRRGADFVGVDLRWGVTEDETRREGALNVCLREIEDCRPFFVGLLGDRYGYVPPPDEVPADFFDTHRDGAIATMRFLGAYERDDTVTPAVYRLRPGLEWSDAQLDALTSFWEATGLPGAGLSITAREILRGVFEDGYPATRAFFYLRNAGIEQHPHFPAALIPVFLEQDPARREGLRQLKERIAGATWIARRPYEVSYAGLSIDPALLPQSLSSLDRRALADGVIAPGEWPALSEPLRGALAAHGTVALQGMEALAEQMLEDLWAAIEPELDTATAPADAAARERLFHERFLDRQTAMVVGRLEDVEWMLAVLEPEESGPRTGIHALTGVAGSGKSTYIAACARAARLVWPDAVVIPYFIGAAPGSSSPLAMLRVLCESLKRAAGTDAVISHDPRELRAQFAELLDAAAAAAPTILFIDALNQLDADGAALGWIPSPLPPGVQLVVSAIEGSGAAAALARRHDVDFVSLRPLAQPDLRELARHFLAQHRKRLTDAQLDALLDPAVRPDSTLPLYVRVALEELSLFGDHATLTRRIAHLPARLPELFEQVLARLEHDHGEALARSVCSWLCAARAGLFEHEVLDLLGRGGDYPRVRWTRLYRALEPYLTPFDEDDAAAGRLDFFHDQLRFAAFRRYLGMRDAQDAPTDRWRAAHRRLASRFRAIAWTDRTARWSALERRALAELPHHLIHAEWWRKLENTLCDLGFVGTCCAAGLTYELAASYDAALHAIPERRAERDREREADRRLRDYRDQLIEHAKNPKEPAPRIASVTPGRREIVWGRQLYGFARFVDAQAHLLARFGAQPGFCLQQAFNSAQDGPVRIAAEQDIHRLNQMTGRSMILNVAPGLLPRWNANEAMLTVIEADASPQIDMSIDGRTAIASVGERLLAWDLDTGERVASFTASTPGGTDVALTADARIAYCGGNITCWDLETRQQVPMPFDIRATSLATSADGRWLFAAFGGVRVLDTRMKRLSDNHWPSAKVVRASASGLRIVTADGSDVLVSDGPALARTFVLKGHSGEVRDLAITPDGSIAASASNDGTARVWDLGSGEQRVSLPHPRDVYAVAITADGRLLLTGSLDRLIRVWDVETRTCLRTLSGHGDWVWRLRVTADGARALSSSEDGTLRLWDITHGITPSERPRAAANARSFTARGAWAVEGGEDGTLTIWEMRHGRVARTIAAHDGRIDHVLLSRDADLALTAGKDDLVRVWSVEDGARLWETKAPVRACTLWPDGNVVLGTPDHDARLHDFRTGSVIWQVKSGNRTFSELLPFPDGKRLLIVDPHGGWPARLLSVPDGNLIHEFIGDEAAVTALGQVVTADYRRVLRVFDAATGLQLHEFSGAKPIVDHSGRFLYAAADDRIVQWDLLTGDRLREFGEGIPEPAPVGLAGGSTKLISIGSDRMVRVWWTSSAACIAMAPAPDRIMMTACTPNGIAATTLSGETICFVADWLED